MSDGRQNSHEGETIRYISYDDGSTAPSTSLQYQAESGIRSVKVIDNLGPGEHEDEDDCYEELEEEEDEMMDEPAPLVYQYETEDLKPSTSHDDQSQDTVMIEPTCLVCGRTGTSRIRLFKWPRNPETRSSWLSFFDLKPEHLNLEEEDDQTAYICSFHFDADQFKIIGNKVYLNWSSYPRFRHRRPASDPFPWEIAQTSQKLTPVNGPIKTGISNENSITKLPVVHLQQRQLPGHDYRVTFRSSYFKNKGRQSHHVAIISSIDNPNIYHEFAYNRTSKLDGTKFYTCLSCRKAKKDSKVRDVIRTIHLDETVILSKGDPFYGHHYNCRPFDAADSYMRQYQPQPLHMDVTGYAGMEEAFEDVQVEVVDDIRWQDSSIINVNGVKYSTIDGEITPFDNRKYIKKRKRLLGLSSVRHAIRCHLCPIRLPSTESLMHHLHQHIQYAPLCIQCQTKTSPDDTPRCRRAKLCTKCYKKPL